MSSRYILDRDAEERRRRLRLLERMQDAATIEYLERIGAAPAVGASVRELFDRVLGAIYGFVGESGIDRRFGGRPRPIEPARATG